MKETLKPHQIEELKEQYLNDRGLRPLWDECVSLYWDMFFRTMKEDEGEPITLWKEAFKEHLDGDLDKFMTLYAEQPELMCMLAALFYRFALEPTDDEIFPKMQRLLSGFRLNGLYQLNTDLETAQTSLT